LFKAEILDNDPFIFIPLLHCIAV